MGGPEPELPAHPGPAGIADSRATSRGHSRNRMGLAVMSSTAAVRGSQLNDAHYLMQWADSFRQVELPNGEVVRGSGDPVIWPTCSRGSNGCTQAMALSVISTLLVVLIAFRARRAGWLALATMFLGMTWLIALLAAAKMHINFLNFVALPITVGVGAGLRGERHEAE